MIRINYLFENCGALRAMVTIVASAFGAWKFPHDPDGKEAGQDESQKEGAE